jgi:diaminopimelate epimerase
MQLPFEKMHGLGNDFVVLDRRRLNFTLSPKTLTWIAHRQLGIGCDQVIVLDAALDHAAFMRIYNCDGSEAEACGNGTRCVAAKLLAETGTNTVTIQSIAGLLHARRAGDQVQVDMGQARLAWQKIPLATAMDTLHVPVDVPGFSGDAVCTNMGNPHAIFFVNDVAALDLPKVGPLLEHHSFFPQRANIGFAQIIDRTHLIFRVWERGSGETLACGSGACAAVVGAIRRGLTERQVTVALQHGNLLIEWRDEGQVLMTGPVARSFSGVMDLSDI